MAWSEDREAYLVEHFANKTNRQLAEELGMAPYQVANKAHQMNLRKSREHRRAVSGRKRCSPSQ